MNAPNSRLDEYDCYTNPLGVSTETLNGYPGDLLGLPNEIKEPIKDLKDLDYNNGKIVNNNI